MKKIILDFKFERDEDVTKNTIYFINSENVFHEVLSQKPAPYTYAFSDCLDFEEVVGKLSTRIVEMNQSMLGVDYTELARIKSMAVTRIKELSNESSL